MDLGGNVGEWTRDRWQRASESCWSGAGILRDPSCNPSSQIDIPSDPMFGPFFGTTRGGAWLNEGHLAQASIRFKQQVFAADAAVGFRCVRRGI